MPSLVGSEMCIRDRHYISPIYSSSFGTRGHMTAHLCRRNRRVDRITRPTLRVLSKSLAKVVVLQFRSIDTKYRFATGMNTDRLAQQLANRQHWIRDRLRVVAELHTSLVLRVLRKKTHRRCLRKHSCHTVELRVHFPKSSQSTQLEPHHQQTWSLSNPHLLLHPLYAGSGAGTSPPAALRSATTALVRLLQMVSEPKAPCFFEVLSCRNAAQLDRCCLEPLRKFTLTDFDVISQRYR